MLKYIHSHTNPIIKEIVSLHTTKGRDQTGYFLLEGENLVNEAIKDNLEIKFIAINEKSSLVESYQDINVEKYLFSELCFKKISTTHSPGNIIAVAKKITFPVSNFFENINSRLILILEDIKDPGNLGSIIRTAAAVSINGIILTGNCVDIFNSKVVRSATGNLWKLPIIKIPEKEKLVELLKEKSFISVVTIMNASKNYYDYNFNQNTALIFGSEASGISEYLIDNAVDRIKIPISKNVESLNVATSVAVILFEYERQKVVNNG